MFSFLSSFISKKKKKREMEKKGLIGSRKRQKTEETLSHVADKSRTIGIIILICVWIASVTVLNLPGQKRAFYTLVPDQIVTNTIRAAFDFSYEDDEKTEIQRNQEKSKVPLVYRIDNELTENCINKVKEFISELIKRSDMEKRGEIYPVDDNDEISRFVGDLSPESVSVLLLIAQNPEQEETFIRNIEFALYRGIINQRIKDTHIYGQKLRIIDHKGRIRKPQLLANLTTPSEAASKIADQVVANYALRNREVLRLAAMNVVSSILKGNLLYDESVTEKNREKQVADIPPVIIEVKKGDIILRKGQEVNREDICKYDAYRKELKGREKSKNFWRSLLNSSVICLILMVVTGIYVSHIHPEVLKSNQKMCLISTVTILSLFLIYGTINLFNILSSAYPLPQSKDLILILIPIGIAPVLLSVLIGLRVAFYVGLFVSVIAALLLEDAYQLIIDGFTIGCIASYAVRHSRNYKIFFIRGVFAVTLAIIIMNYRQLWSIMESFNVVYWTFCFALVNGVLTATLALIILFILEPIFQISTDMTLLLLSDYNHPLLKRLQLEAPGSYHHSLMVATLAEQAAEVIGANPIRARVCALFHDIGKLSQPEYFIENTFEGENKHNELRPQMSSLIILNHVKEGTDMAITYKLRKIIRDAIEQHHGTDLVYFFYKRALEENRDKNTPVEEQAYRYPGPLPREKEVVLVSLADACEAASRSLQKPSPGKVEALVWEIFRKRIRDGQLDEADLTFGDLARVRRSFVKTITTMLHGRIAYPKDEDKDDEDDLFKAAKKVSTTEKEAPKKAAEKSSETDKAASETK